MASQEAKVEVEEERKFREERMVLFGDENNSVTEQPKASRHAQSKQKSGSDRERTGSTSQHASVSLHAVSEEVHDSPDAKQQICSQNGSYKF